MEDECDLKKQNGTQSSKMEIKQDIVKYINGIRLGDDDIINTLIDRIHTISEATAIVNAPLQSVTTRKEEIINLLDKYRKNRRRRSTMAAKSVSLSRASVARSMAATSDAISDSSDVPELVEIKLHDGLSKAAEQHAEDIGEHGILGHIGSDGSDVESRIESFVVWANACAESLCYSTKHPIDVVLSLLVDEDGTGSRNRRYMLSEEHRYIGIGISKHKIKGECVVIDYVGNIAEIKGPRKAVETVENVEASTNIIGKSYVRQQVSVAPKVGASTAQNATKDISNNNGGENGDGSGNEEPFTPLDKIILSAKETAVKANAISSSTKVTFKVTKTATTTEKKERIVTNEYTLPDGRVSTFVHTETCTLLEFKPTKSRNAQRKHQQQ